MNFKKISIILAALLLLLVVLKIKDKKQGDRSFKAYVVSIDTSKVDKMSITPKGASDKVELFKNEGLWMLKLNGKDVQANIDIIDELLSQVSSLKTKSVAATSKEKWGDYEVTDSTGTRISINSGKKQLADFMIGKFSYKQPQGQNPYQQQQNIQMTSYLRLINENEVYAVDGYLSMMFNRDANSFRENSVVVGKPDNWNKLIFNYPADSSFTLVKQNNKWMVNGILADSMAISSYFSKIRMLTNNNFDDETFIDANQQPEMSVRIEGDNFTPIMVDAYKNSMGEPVFTSSINKGNLMKAGNTKQALFVGQQQFIK